jgi:4-hydroxy-tetrahydrodipicolinate synthase
MARFGRVLTAMVTPFDADGGLDLEGARTLARWLESHGNDGLVVAGTTGESPVLTDEEKLSLWAAVAEAVSIPVIAGTGTNDTAHSVHLTKEVSSLGVAAVMAVCPYYNRPSQAGLDAHFRAVAAATDLPVVIYDIPIRTGRKVTTATLLRLAREVPNVLALKDAAGNPGETAALISSAPDGYEVYSGDDSMTLPLLASGAAGVIGVATHWTGTDHQDLFDLWGKGDVVGARLVNARLLESFAFETGDEAPNPLPTKAMLRVLGLAVGQARLPMGPAPAGLEDRAREVLANLERWRDAFPGRPDRQPG